MTHETMLLLEEQFDTAFAAPDGIQKLRELILTLAMQGKLVPQDPNDRPASELLKEIKEEKKKLVEEGKIKQSNPLPDIKLDEVPYDLPKGWQWVRFGEITINRDSERIPVSREERQKMFGEYDYYGASGVIDKVNKFLFEKDLLLIGEDGANLINRSTPIAFVARGKYWVNNHAHVVDAIYFDLLLYLEKHINAIDLKPYITGTAQPKMNQAKMNSIVIGLPPLPEQFRIVAKIDQLMARCDELEKVRGERAQKLITVHTAAIDRLLAAQDSRDFSTAWHFITQHFGQLYSVKETVAELRKTILQLAVMGKLVPQDPNDEPASELLKAIEIEKQRLVKEGKIKLQKPLPKNSLKEMPYSLPNGWEWSRLEDIVDISSGVTMGRKLHNKDIIALPYLRVANVQRGYLDLGVIKEIEISKDEIERFELKERDLLITEGGDWDKVGRTAIWNGEISLCIHQNHIFKARRLLSKQNEQWIEKYMNSAIARAYFANASKQTTNLASINKTQLRGCPIPIPPLAEQHRIIAKVDQLMALCDHLEEAITASQSKQTDLLNAVMAQV